MIPDSISQFITNYQLKYRTFAYEVQKFRKKVPPEFRFVVLSCLLYGCFMTWGYLQEKITSTAYESYTLDDIGLPLKEIRKWKFPLVLNMFVTLTGAITSFLARTLLVTPPSKHDRRLHHHSHLPEAPFYLFSKPAISAAVASTISYLSLQFISYPLMILTKSCKHIPVMIVGKLFYDKKYHWTKYLSVLMICNGILLFTAMKDDMKKNIKPEAHNDVNKGSEGIEGLIKEDGIGGDLTLSISVIIGLVLIFIHLILDGVTSNEQDNIFSHYHVTALQMMQNINAWQSLYSSLYLIGELISKPYQLTSCYKAFDMLISIPMVFYDISIFCFCSCVGQIFIFGLIREFGSLSWITISVTRQLFTILLSVFLFNHHIAKFQWFGIGLVFTGLGIEILVNYYQKKQLQYQKEKEREIDKEKEKQKKLQEAQPEKLKEKKFD
jgi:UDP-galactose transporter B1